MTQPPRDDGVDQARKTEAPGGADATPHADMPHGIRRFIPTQIHRWAVVRVTWSAITGVVVGSIVSGFTIAQAAALIGWDAAAAFFLVCVYVDIWRLDAASTQQRATRFDPSRFLADGLVISAGVAILAAVALALAQAGHNHGADKAYLLTVGTISVALSWFSIQTIFTLRYARLYYGGEPGGIDFNEPDQPNYVDFAYLAFTIGMTFQVSDTNLTAKPVRRTALQQGLISYLFGAVIIALVINIVASLI
jgi:uncharacterized membrane protein